MEKPSSVLIGLLSQLGVIGKFAESTLHPMSQVKIGDGITPSTDPQETFPVTKLSSSTLQKWSYHFFIPVGEENGYSKQGLFFPRNEKVQSLMSGFFSE